MSIDVPITPMAFFFDADFFTRETAEEWLRNKHRIMPAFEYSTNNDYSGGKYAHAFIFTDNSTSAGGVPIMFVALGDGITLGFAEKAPAAVANDPEISTPDP